MSETGPRVLVVYCSHAQQNGKVTEAMAKAFGERGCDVTQAAIEFTDKRSFEPDCPEVARAFTNELADGLGADVTKSH